MPTLEMTKAEPVWDIAKIFPDQGSWSVQEYLALETNRLIEFSHGFIEVLPMPSQYHQFSVMHLLFMLRAFFATGTIKASYIVSPMKAKLWEGKYREPDLMVMLSENDHRRQDLYWESPDFVAEVVSPDDPKRDTETKRREYAMAGIKEYWIVNPLNQSVTVLALDGDTYTVAGEYQSGENAISVILPGFSAGVSELFRQSI